MQLRLSASCFCFCAFLILDALWYPQQQDRHPCLTLQDALMLNVWCTCAEAVECGVPLCD